MSTDIFGPALETLKISSWGIFGPKSFIGYIEENGLSARATAASISIDSLDKLSPTLRKAQAMVLRLGGAVDGERGTKFAVVTTPNRLEDFFIIDANHLTQSAPTTFLPESSFRDLFPYFVFPKLTENALVNLALASGLLGFALGLERPYPTAAPVTGKSTFSFKVRPHSEIDIELNHDKGQVEVDAILVGRRKDVNQDRVRDCVFVLETKSGPHKSLAKHKLVYPILGLASRVPSDMAVIPVYMRAEQLDNSIRYDIWECQLPDPRKSSISLDQLRPINHKQFSLPIPRLL